MKSTGECLGIGKTFNEALYKAFLQGAGFHLPKYKKMIITVRDDDKEEIVDIARRSRQLATRSMRQREQEQHFVQREWIPYISKLEQDSPNLLDLILGHQIDLVIDTPTQGAEHSHDGFIIRRNAIETGVNVLTAIDTAKALITSLENREEQLTLIDIATI